jgi:Ion channel
MQKLYRVLSNINPLSYILSYIALAILFAFIYTMPVFNFYHSTIQYEEIIENNKITICSSLYKLIFREIFVRFNSPENTFTRWRIFDELKTQPHPSVCKFNDEKVNLASHISAENKNWKELKDRDTSNGTLYVDFTIDDLDKNNLEYLEIYPELKYEPGYSFTMPAEFGQGRSASLFPNISIKDVGIIKLPRKFQRDILDQVQAEKGFPSKIPNHFLRMLYFSLVTITTTGYGDILPINIYARLLTGTEALLGTIIAGLFINSIFQSRLIK